MVEMLDAIKTLGYRWSTVSGCLLYTSRRVRAVGELLQNQVRIGLLRMERIARERMTTTPDLATAMAKDLIVMDEDCGTYSGVEIRPLPVSYTHLDVYKRQPVERLRVVAVNIPDEADSLALEYRACLLYTSRYILLSAQEA